MTSPLPAPAPLDPDTAPLAQRFGKLVYHARKAKRMAQREVADAVGCTQPHIVNLEKGRVDPDLSLVGRLMDVLGIDARTVFTAPARRRKHAA